MGRTLPEFNQDLFLAIKYSDEPVRFTPAELKSHYSSNDSNLDVYDFSATGFASYSNAVHYNATEYGYDCPGYGSDTIKLVKMELIRLIKDCLNLNVIRPKDVREEEDLPVMLWVFGGFRGLPRILGELFDGRAC